MSNAYVVPWDKPSNLTIPLPSDMTCYIAGSQIA